MLRLERISFFHTTERSVALQRWKKIMNDCFGNVVVMQGVASMLLWIAVLCLENRRQATSKCTPVLDDDLGLWTK
jgi:hypothetical protein